MSLINSETALADEVQSLAQLEPRFAIALAKAGSPELRTRPTGFLQLYKVIVSQQLSVAAAASIW